MITLNSIRAKVVEAIRNSGMSQVEIAAKLGVSQPTIAQYLSGRAMPALDTFANLCIILDLDPTDILCIDDTKNC